MFGVQTRLVERTNHIHKERKGTQQSSNMDSNYHKNKTRNSPDKEQRDPAIEKSKICRVRREGHGSRRRILVSQNHIPTDKAPQLVFQSTTLVHLAANQFKERKRRLGLKGNWEAMTWPLILKAD
jgi:hypothetical protein